jgi:hypothetical protein
MDNLSPSASATFSATKTARTAWAAAAIELLA